MVYKYTRNNRYSIVSCFISKGASVRITLLIYLKEFMNRKLGLYMLQFYKINDGTS